MPRLIGSNRGQLRRSFFGTKVAASERKETSRMQCLESFDCSSASSPLNSGSLETKQSVEYIFLLFELNCALLVSAEKGDISFDHCGLERIGERRKNTN